MRSSGQLCRSDEGVRQLTSAFCTRIVGFLLYLPRLVSDMISCHCQFGTSHNPGYLPEAEYVSPLLHKADLEAYLNQLDTV